MECFGKLPARCDIFRNTELLMRIIDIFGILSYICTKKEGMRVVSQRKLREFYESPGHEDSKIPLERRYHTVTEAQWTNFAEMKRDFNSVDSVGNQHYVFNIGGNKYRLVVVVKFVMGYVFVRFVGTHKEYERINAASI